MKRKSSAEYQREYRRRLREQGFIKKEIWILPEHARQLATIERQLRQSGRKAVAARLEETMTNVNMWTTKTLFEALQGVDLCKSGNASIELIEGTDPTVHITMHHYGELPMFLIVTGEQIIADTVLWPLADVRSPFEFNEEVLRTHKLFPLSTISLDTLPDGHSYYTMFGALSAYSSLSNIVLEVEMLAENVINATEAYSEFLIDDAA